MVRDEQGTFQKIWLNKEGNDMDLQQKQKILKIGAVLHRKLYNKTPV